MNPAIIPIKVVIYVGSMNLKNLTVKNLLFILSTIYKIISFMTSNNISNNIP